jgi:hypothetical protein
MPAYPATRQKGTHVEHTLRSSLAACLTCLVALACGGSGSDAASLQIQPTTVTLAPLASVTFTATAQNLPSTAVTWAVLEAGGGVVDGAGRYTAPAATGIYHVVVTSAADTSKSATASVNVVAASASLAIAEAQRSGVAGFPIGVFGSGFGASQGASTITIGGVNAPVTTWSDGFIAATVPAVADQATQIVVTVGGFATYWPFQVYSVDPRFKTPPALLENLLIGRTLVLSGFSGWFSNGSAPDPATALPYNSGDGSGQLSTSGGLVAMPLGAAIAGDVWFSWMGNSSGYDNADVQGRQPPTAYTIEGSANSTTGSDGTWTQLASISGNTKWGRSHKLTLGGHSWLRWTVTAGTTATTNLMEVRVFRVKSGSASNGLDSWGIIGDSITADDLGHAGDLAFWGRIKNARADGTYPMPLVMGFSGSKTDRLIPGNNPPVSDLGGLISLEPDVRFWGIALGINDYGYSDSSTTGATDRSNLDAGIRAIIAAGKVPVLIRVAYTLNNVVQPPTTDAMLYNILRNQDELAAQYRLPPGPDFYTFFRRNPSSIRGDGIHHNPGDFNEEILWSQAMQRSGVYGP